LILANKILVVGSNSPHVASFCRMIKPDFRDIVYLGDETLNIENDTVSNQYIVSPKVNNPFKIFHLVNQIKKVIKVEQPDVIHIHQINRLGIYSTFCIEKPTPLIVTAWGSDVLQQPKENFIKKSAVKYVLKKALACTADSQHMVDEMRKLQPAMKQCQLIYFGINPIGYISDLKENIIYSNRLHKDFYNIDKIIKDFSSFSTKHPDWKLIIAANGPETDKLKALSHRLGLENKIEFVGWLDKSQNINFYKKARIYISIPDSDGTSVSLLEAMSAGCLPIIGDIPVSHEWIENSKNGVIYSAKRNCFEEALNIESEKLREHNSKIIQQKATKEISAKNFFTLYADVLNKSDVV